MSKFERQWGRLVEKLVLQPCIFHGLPFLGQWHVRMLLLALVIIRFTDPFARRAPCSDLIGLHWH